MKKILVVGLLSFAFLSYGQRKELRQAEKLLDQSFYNEALNVLSQIESMIDGVDQKYQAYYYYLEGWALKGDSKFNIKELQSKYLFTLGYCFLEKILLKKRFK